VSWLHSHLSFFHLIATVGHLLPCSKMTSAFEFISLVYHTSLSYSVVGLHYKYWSFAVLIATIFYPLHEKLNSIEELNPKNLQKKYNDARDCKWKCCRHT